MNKGSFLTYANNFRRLYKQMFQPYAKKFGLTQLEIDCLLFLRNNPGMNTARDISVMRGFAKSNVSNAVESLRSRGYVLIQPDPKNRRIHRLILTESARDMVEELAVCQENCFAVVVQGFFPEHLALLHQLFEQANANVLNSLNHTES